MEGLTCRSSTLSLFLSPELRLNSSMVQEGCGRLLSVRPVKRRSVYRGLPFMCDLTEGGKWWGLNTCSTRYESFGTLDDRCA